jgi:sugar phosphate isomerase/epimerase
MSIQAGVNMEFIRSQDKSFAEGVERAARLGYRFVEPMVHNGRELLSEAGYFHSFSLDDDPGEMKDILEQYGVRASGLSAHCPLMRPEISVPYLQKAIRFAAAIGAPVVNTDEGIRPSWVSMDEVFPVMKYTPPRSCERPNDTGFTSASNLTRAFPSLPKGCCASPPWWSRRTCV